MPRRSSCYCYSLWGHDDLKIEIPEEVFPDEAFRNEKDRLFDFPEHGFFVSCHEGKKLHYRKNLPPSSVPIRAIIVWQHGIHGQSGFGMQLKLKQNSNSNSESESELNDSKDSTTATATATATATDGQSKNKNNNNNNNNDNDNDNDNDGHYRYCDMALRIRRMNAMGYVVYAHDQLGHGFSEGERFYIPNGDWSVNRDDLVAFAKMAASEHPSGTPLFLCGDSYGGCLAFHAAHVFQTQEQIQIEQKEQIEQEQKQKHKPSITNMRTTNKNTLTTHKGVNFLGCALNCPALDGEFPAWPVVWFLRYILKPWFPLWTPFFMPHPITPERIWKVPEVRDHYTDPNKRHGLSESGTPYCLGTAAGLVDAIQSAQRLFSSFEVPFHINHGSDDYGVPCTGSQRLFQHSKTPTSDKELNIVPNGYHGLLSQHDAEDTMRREIEWIEKRIEGNSNNIIANGK